MTTWPLERIAHLDFQAFAAVVQSMTQTKLDRRQPLAFSAKAPEEFAATRWENLGCTREDLEAISRQFAAMFHVGIQPPAPNDEVKIFVRKGLSMWQNGERPVTFFTSGSTGVPKPCTHLESHLRQIVASVAPLVEDRDSALVTVPLYHSYGFNFGLLLPLSLGIPIRSLQPLPTLVDAHMRPKDMVVGIPLLWSRLVDMKNWQTNHSDTARNITIFTSTAPTPPEVIHALRANGFRTVEIFGSSETSAICYRENPDDPFCLLPHVERGRGKHEGTLERLLPEGKLMRYPLLDAVTWIGERSLRPGTRLDQAVQVAGVNVYPDRVAERIRSHPLVRDCTVRLMRPDEGARLKAFIVPACSPEEATKHFGKTFHAWCAEQLDPPSRPQRIRLGETLPVNAMGKASDWD